MKCSFYLQILSLLLNCKRDLEALCPLPTFRCFLDVSGYSFSVRVVKHAFLKLTRDGSLFLAEEEWKCPLCLTHSKKILDCYCDDSWYQGILENILKEIFSSLFSVEHINFYHLLTIHEISPAPLSINKHLLTCTNRSVIVGMIIKTTFLYFPFEKLFQNEIRWLNVFWFLEIFVMQLCSGSWDFPVENVSLYN